MSEQKAAIPEDLRRLYSVYKAELNDRSGAISSSARHVLKLIERIATLDAENAKLAREVAAQQTVITSGNAVMAEQMRMIEELRATIAGLLTVDAAKVAEYVVLDPKALREAAGNRVAELEAKVRRLEAPVSNEEWYEYLACYEPESGGSYTNKHYVEAWIAARSTPPAKETAE